MIFFYKNCYETEKTQSVCDQTSEVWIRIICVRQMYIHDMEYYFIKLEIEFFGASHLERNCKRNLNDPPGKDGSVMIQNGTLVTFI